jgi:hypothetical protein
MYSGTIICINWSQNRQNVHLLNEFVIKHSPHSRISRLECAKRMPIYIAAHFLYNVISVQLSVAPVDSPCAMNERKRCLKKVVGGFILFFALFSLVFFGTKSYFFSIGYAQPVYKDDRGVLYVSRVEGKKFQILNAQGAWEDSFLAGVNIGLGVPGSFPGEFAIGQETYFDWFTQIADMGSNVIRVYTPQTPDFYQALYEYNRLAGTPLYLLQGVYMDESDVLRYSDVFAPESIAIRAMRQDIVDCINMLHGNAVVGTKAGKASGVYRYDVSRYVAGWILGIECEAYLVDGTNKAHPEITSFDGDYVYVKDASPFEVFIAQMKELANSY